MESLSNTYKEDKLNNNDDKEKRNNYIKIEKAHSSENTIVVEHGLQLIVL